MRPVINKSDAMAAIVMTDITGYFRYRYISYVACNTVVRGKISNTTKDNNTTTTVLSINNKNMFYHM